MDRDELVNVLLDTGVEAYGLASKLHKAGYQHAMLAFEFRASIASCAHAVNKVLPEKPIEEESLAGRFLESKLGDGTDLDLCKEICRLLASAKDQEGLLKVMLHLYWPTFATDTGVQL